MSVIKASEQDATLVDSTLSHRKPKANNNGKSVSPPTSQDESSPLSQEFQKILEGEIHELRQRQKKYREKVTLFRSPFTTLKLCLIEALLLLQRGLHFVLRHKAGFIGLLLLVILDVVMNFVEGPHQKYLNYLQTEAKVALEWIVLGVLSSIGLGTGLHTFVLYLGPHIAKVTLAATECNSLQFDTQGPNAFMCPPASTISPKDVTFWAIVHKVQFACFCWGLGTALGELPPYFVARAARLSGERLDDLDEFPSDKQSTKLSSVMKRFREYFDKFLSKYTFIMILLLASVPNPLFDLAGLTCGYSLIPFWTFFGATVVGKAGFKAHLQCALVVSMFMKEHLANAIDIVERMVPFLHGKVSEAFERERAKFHPEHVGVAGTQKNSPIAMIWNIILFSMLFMFFVSIINSTARSRLVEMDEREVGRFTKVRTAELEKQQQDADKVMASNEETTPETTEDEEAKKTK
eukprot:GEZU01027964.1.p1 GENE.GEZU01027964.1~~GEZU01027964.1.p1  ORF type:complete len:464 (+),score=106.42 GEZU01027964.1:199-1590(+)